MHCPVIPRNIRFVPKPDCLAKSPEVAEIICRTRLWYDDSMGQDLPQGYLRFFRMSICPFGEEDEKADLGMLPVFLSRN